ncbi:MAG: hypothetical protein R3E95_10555 [Thiolinea sp.]
MPAAVFLGELTERVEEGDYTILVAGREWARDLEAPPAMSQGRQIFIRRESLRRLLWGEGRRVALDGPG